MSFYFVPSDLVYKVPLEIYKDNIIIMARVITGDTRIVSYDLYYDYDCYDASRLDLFVLYDLDEEDILHLNLIGIVIKIGTGSNIPSLLTAAGNKDSTFQFRSIRDI